MPVKIVPVSEARGTAHLFSGAVDGEQIVESIRVMLREPEKLPALRFALIDLSESEQLNVSNDDVQLIVEQDRKLNSYLSPGFMVAIVASRDVHFGLARMWQTYVESTGWDTAIFRNVEEAEVWIQQNMLRINALALPSFHQELMQVRA